eukprot:symbB.v1.2.000514.t1/scaffold31.1/size418471/10
MKSPQQQRMLTDEEVFTLAPCHALMSSFYGTGKASKNSWLSPKEVDELVGGDGGSTSPRNEHNAKLHPSTQSTQAPERTKSTSQSFYAYGPPGTPHSDFVRIVSSKLPYHARPDRPSRTLNDWIASTTSVPEVLSLVASYGSEFDGTNTATALHRLAKWYREVPDARLFQDRRWHETLDHLDRNMQAPAFQTRHLTSSLWSFATMGRPAPYCPGRLFHDAMQAFVQPVLTSQPSGALLHDDSQKTILRKADTMMGFEDMVSEPQREDAHSELLAKLSQLYNQKEVQIENLNQEVSRLQGRLVRMSMENADLKSSVPPTPIAFRHEELTNHPLVEAEDAEEDGEEVPKERLETEAGNGDVPPSSLDHPNLDACQLPSDFFDGSEVGKIVRKVELLPRWSERVSWEAARIASVPRSECNLEAGKLDSEGNKDGVERQGCQRFILLPSDPKRMAWDLTGMVLLVYDMIVIPISAFEPEETMFTIFMEWTTQIFWTFDVVMSLLTGYVHKGQLVMSPWAILIHYLKTWFVLDLVVVGPDWVMTFIQLSAPTDEEGGTSGSVSRLMRSIRVVRTVRLLRLVKLKRVIDMAKDRITSEVVFILLNILKLIVLLLLVNHFVASLWYLMGGVANPGQLNWRDVYGMQPQQQSIEYRYATALHWSLTQFTPATVDVHPQNLVERTFAILVLIFGLVLFSSFVSSITASMTQLRNMQEDKSKQFWLLRRYLLQKKVPQELNFKVLRYTEYATSRSGEAIPEHRITILNVLTKQLQSELRFVTHFGCVKQHGFLRLVCVMNESILHLMSSGKALVLKALASQDPLFEVVDPPFCMYFVEQGQIQYTQGQSGALASGTFAPNAFESEGFLPTDPDVLMPATPTEAGTAIGKGGNLCEIALWAHWKHVGSARAVYESNIVQVIAKGFADCIRRDPAVDSMAAMYARMFVKMVNDPDRILEDEQDC